MIEQRPWRDVGVEGIGVVEFPYPIVVDDGKDELRRLPPRRLVGSAVCALRFVRSFCARTDDGRGVVIDCGIVRSHLLVMHCFRFVVQDLKK